MRVAVHSQKARSDVSVVPVSMKHRMTGGANMRIPVGTRFCTPDSERTAE